MGESKRKRLRAKQTHEIQDTGAILSGICITLFVLLFAATKLIPLRAGGLSAGGYFAAGMNVYYVLFALFPIFVQEIVTSFMRKRMNKDLFANAKRALYAGFLGAIAFIVVTFVVIIALQKPLSSKILLGEKNVLVLALLLPALYFSVLTGVLKGFFESQGKRKKLLIYRMVSYFVMVIAMIICVAIFKKNGEKVAAVLASPSHLSVLIAAGAALGITLGSAFSFLLHYAFFLKARKRFYKIARKDKSRGVEDVTSILKIMLQKYFPLLLSCLFLALPYLINQIQFTGSYRKHGIESMLAYSLGAYGAILPLVVCIPLTLVWLYLSFAKSELKRSLSGDDRMEAKLVLRRILKTNLLIVAFFSACLIGAAGVLDNAILGHQSALAEKLIRFYAIYLLIFTYVITCLRALFYTKSLHHGAYIIPFFGMILHIVLNIIFLSSGKMGVLALVVADLLYGLIMAAFVTFALKSAIRFELDLFGHVAFPIALCIIAGLVIFLLSLVLQFPFANVPVLNCILSFAIGFIVYFIAMIKSNVVSAEELYNVPGGLLLHNLGSLLRLF